MRCKDCKDNIIEPKLRKLGGAMCRCNPNFIFGENSECDKDFGKDLEPFDDEEE